MSDHSRKMPAISSALSMPEGTGGLEPLGVPFMRFRGILRRHWRTMLATMLIIVGGTSWLVLESPRSFTAGAILLIEPRRTPVSDLQAISAAPGDITSLIRTQIDILNSPSLLKKVASALHLPDDRAFMQPPMGPLGRLSVYLRGLLATSRGPVTPLTAEQKLELAAGTLAGKISYANEMRSSVLHVLVTTQEPTLSARIANEIARQFLAFKRQEKFSAMQHADEWFRAQLTGLADQVHASEVAIEQYKAEHGLIGMPSESGGGQGSTMTLTQRELNEVSSQLTQASGELTQKEASLAQAKAAGNGAGLASVPDVVISPVIAALLAQETTVASRAAQLAASEGPNNPELKAVRAQLGRIEGRIATERTNIVQSLSRQIQATRQQVQMLGERVRSLRQQVNAEERAEVGLRGLLAKSRATRSLYDSFLTRATELSNTAGIQEPDASLVSSATPPLGPSGPQRTRFIAVALVLSLIAGVTIACLLERLRQGFASPEQVESYLGIPTVAMIPAIPKRSQRPTATDRHARQFRASFDNFRGQLLSLGNDRPKVILVTSALPQEGKSMTATAIATNAAAAGWRVLLLECDFRRPSLAKQFHLAAAPGLNDILSGRMLGSAATTLFEVRPRLHLLPSGSSFEDPQELLASNRMTQLLAAFRNHYDLIMVDTPPVIPASDALVLCRHADATLLVVRWEKTPRSAVQDAVDLLSKSRATLFGAALTRVDLRHAAQSSGRPAKLYEYCGSYHAARV